MVNRNILILRSYYLISFLWFKCIPIWPIPKIIINEDKNNFFDFRFNDVKIEGYPREKIKTLNPQEKLEIAI